MMEQYKPKCNHPPNRKCINCFTETVGQFKHESFDSYIKELQKKNKLNLQTFAMEQSYKVNYKCPTGHEPYPKGVCGKCRPPTIVLSRQIYRHVDYLSFMNHKELGKFIGFWQRTGYYEQRFGYLYGYFSTDPNYPEGVRVNIEAVYDPPQIGD